MPRSRDVVLYRLRAGPAVGGLGIRPAARPGAAEEDDSVDDHGDEPRSPDRRDPTSDDAEAGSFEEERVRIIGADEARAAMERGQPIARAGADNGDARFAEMRFNPS